MSKTQQAKTAQGYIEKPVHPMCSNCSSCQQQLSASENDYYKCTLGNFNVTPKGCCDKHEFNNQ